MRQLNKTLLPIIFDWRNEFSYVQNCTSRNVLSSLKEFETEINNDFSKDRQIQFVIYFNNNPIGTIYSYSYNRNDGYVFVTVYIKPKFANKSIGIRAFLEFSKFLFKKYQLYKIYIDIYSFNSKMISIIDKTKFSKEGVFKNQHKKKGIRFDVIRYAVYEKDIVFWTSKIKKTANILYS